MKEELFVGTNPSMKSRPYVHLSMLAKNKYDVKKKEYSKQKVRKNLLVAGYQKYITANNKSCYLSI